MSNVGNRVNNKGHVGKAGAKPKPEGKKKNPVTVYIEQDKIDEHGGIEKAREIARETLNSPSAPLA